MPRDARKRKKKAEPEPEPPAPPSWLDRWRQRFRVFILVSGVLATVVWFSLPQIGRSLVLTNDLAPADVLIVLSGDQGERMEYAFSLYQKGMAELFLLTGGPLYADLSEADLLRRHAVILGVPEEKIIMETKAVNTYQNAKFTREIMERHRLDSAIVVSSPYHMRRVRNLFDEVYEGSNILLAYAPVNNSWFNPETWWQSSQGRRLVFSEYFKLTFESILPQHWRAAYYTEDQN